MLAARDLAPSRQAAKAVTCAHQAAVITCTHALLATTTSTIIIFTIQQQVLQAQAVQDLQETAPNSKGYAG